MGDWGKKVQNANHFILLLVILANVSIWHSYFVQFTDFRLFLGSQGS